MVLDGKLVLTAAISALAIKSERDSDGGCVVEVKYQGSYSKYHIDGSIFQSKPHLRKERTIKGCKTTSHTHRGAHNHTGLQ